jgi:hypothetical protein
MDGVHRGVFRFVFVRMLLNGVFFVRIIARP